MRTNEEMQDLEDRIYGPCRDEPGFREYHESRGRKVYGPLPTTKGELNGS